MVARLADILAAHGSPRDEGRALQILINAGFRAAEIMPDFDAAMSAAKLRRAA